MENLEEKETLIISKSVQESLENIVFWSKFLAIAGFIGIGFIGVAAISMLFYYLVGAIIYIVIGVIYFYPIYFLYQFSNSTKSALNKNSQNDLNEGMRNLASSFKLVGIYALVTISLYALILLFAGGMRFF